MKSDLDKARKGEGDQVVLSLGWGVRAHEGAGDRSVHPGGTPVPS